MPDDITTVGAEFLAKYLFTETATKPTSTAIGLYDNQTDTLYDPDTGDIDESSDMADITTEPDDGSYTRLSYAFGQTDFTTDTNLSGNWRGNFTEKAFDLTDTTGYADSYFEVIAFQATGDSAVTDHLFMFGPLLDSNGNQLRIDLGSASSFDYSGALIIP